MAAYYLLLVAAALSVLSSTEAGCYRGRPKPVIPPELYHWNDEPTTLLAARHLPRRFDWSDVDGQNLIVSSWGQHQPIYCGSCWVHGTLSMVRHASEVTFHLGVWTAIPECDYIVSFLNLPWYLCVGSGPAKNQQEGEGPRCDAGTAVTAELRSV